MTASLGLGTVQFGLPYGVTNRDGQPTPAIVSDILAAARAAGVTMLDTAAAYGSSERVLGQCSLDGFTIVTKVPRLAAASDPASEAVATFDRSLAALRQSSVDGLLVHDADDLIGANGEAVMTALRRQRATGRTRRIGASIYTPGQIDALLDRYDDIDLVQVPLNAIDQRLVASGQLGRLADRGVDVHARSAFLQGLLLASPDEIPDRLAGSRPVLRRWHDAVRQARTTPIAAALGFVRDLPGIEAVIVGVATLAQFVACAAAFADPRGFDATGLSCADADIVDPSRWPAEA